MPGTLIWPCMSSSLEQSEQELLKGGERIWAENNVPTVASKYRCPRQSYRQPRCDSRCLADRPEDRFSTMEEVCTLLHEVTTDSGSSGCSTVPTAHTTARGKDQSSDTRRASMILNNIAVRTEDSSLSSKKSTRLKRHERKASALLS